MTGRDDHADGVAFVDLVTATDPAMVVAAVADAVGVPERAGGSRHDALMSALADRDCLIVLDNCEHLLGGVRACVDDLLGACPSVRVLATSRVRLMYPGEHVYPVPGLAIDDGDGRGDAVELFIVRLVAGGACGAGRAPTNLIAVRELCGMLDGMALAIELAAARASSLGLDGLREAVRGNLELLSLGHRFGDRHHSLRSTIDWSYNLLDESERAVLRSCAVFAAPFTLDAASEVLAVAPAELLGTLGRLVDWNLVTLRPGLPSRYRILETIRQYATELAASHDELDTIRVEHLRWCLLVFDDLAERAPGDASWCADVDLMVDDARAAIGWATDRGERATRRRWPCASPRSCSSGAGRGGPAALRPGGRPHRRLPGAPRGALPRGAGRARPVGRHRGGGPPRPGRRRSPSRLDTASSPPSTCSTRRRSSTATPER